MKHINLVIAFGWAIIISLLPGDIFSKTLAAILGMAIGLQVACWFVIQERERHRP